MKLERLQLAPKGKFSIEDGRAFSLVEAILSLALFAVLAMAFVGAVVYGQESAVQSGQRTRAAFLADEGLEAIRSIRDDSFANLTDGVHGLAVQNNQWFLTGVPDVTEIFTRQITISSIDADHKQIAAQVSWNASLQRTASVNAATILSNWRSLGGSAGGP